MARLACTFVIEGELGERFRDAFDSLTLTSADGRSQLTGTVADQAELRGVLRQLFDLGLEVVSFTSGTPSVTSVGGPESPG